ncbi:MAG: endonuclease MutS2 [Saccharofermentans sp.]|nr:endonuclease MutS2 [Saccharofermentans sp.]
MYKYTTFEEEAIRKQIKGRVLRVLEFDKIISRLTSLARTEYGKSLAQDLVPTTDYSVVAEALNDTNEAYTYINKYGPLPMGGFPKINDALSYTKAGGILSTRQLLDIAIFLRSTAGLKAVISNEHADMAETNLFSSIDALDTVESLEKRISNAIAGEDEIYDRASNELYEIRREQKDISRNIRVILDRVIRNNEDILQEAIITIRGERFCVPLRAEFKSRLPGIVHDTSSTGQTIFVEPMAVVEANNRLRELASMEKAEIERILEDLTHGVKKERNRIESDISIVSCIDLACAKADLAIEMDAVVPALNTDGHIRLMKARHPLIDPEVVVPVDIENGYNYRSLIITGPNTGGKTVSLKTCGLLTLMAMAGLMIPCSVGSEIAVFDRVLAGIGDEQSIEQSLSTFSAQMSNIVFILKNVRGKSLVLLDELGSGTDPAEGAALAIAVLDELYEKGCVTMATTHYKELKAYALTTEGVMNASCEFDTDTLSPTYRLVIGTPGVSNAFVISKKLGLPNRIIDDAMKRLSEEEVSFERLISEAQSNSKEAARLKEENEKLNNELMEKIQALNDEKAALKASKTRILNDSRAKQKELLEEKEEELDNLIRDLRKKNRKTDKEEQLEELDKIRRRLRAGIKDLRSDDEDDKILEISLPGEPPKSVKEGETYFVPSMNTTGVVVSAPSGKNKKVRISCGSLTYTVDIKQLRMPTASQTEKKEQPTKTRRDVPVNYKADSATQMRYKKSTEVMSELMLLGKTSMEAESALDSYIDDCQLAGIKNIRIVHGKGTGALRSTVDVMLRGDSRVKSHRLGMPGEGDDGVTIAELY